jgi:integrase
MANWFSWSGTSGTATGAARAKEGPREVLIADLYAAIERDYKIGKKRTFSNVEGVWENHLKAFFGAQPVAPFRPSRVKKYVEDRLLAEAANATINRELAVLKRMASLAIEEYEAESEDEKLLAALMRWSRIKFLDESDNVRSQMVPFELYDSFAIETAREGLWFRAMYEFTYTRGWRPGSLKQLLVENVDLGRRTVRLTGKQTKNKRPCEIHMTDTEYELVKQCVQAKGPKDYLLTRERDHYGRKPKNGGRIIDYRDAWKRVCQRVGVAPGKDGLIFYDLKRTGATNLADALGDVKKAMANTGHLTESSFRRYQQVNDEEMRESARKIERAHRERQTKARFKQAEMFIVDPARKPA